MDAAQVPATLPVIVTRARPLVATIMAESLNEQGPNSYTAAAWRWVLTGHGLSPVSGTPGAGTPPGIEEIEAEALYGRTTDPPLCGYPPWRHRNDFDPDRQQARRVLRWLTGAADAIPLIDPARGRHVGARFHLARTDEELRLVRGWALHGIREHGDLPDDMPQWRAERPWGWPSWWMNAAWLRGTIAYLDWIFGDTPIAPCPAGTSRSTRRPRSLARTRPSRPPSSCRSTASASAWPPSNGSSGSTSAPSSCKATKASPPPSPTSTRRPSGEKQSSRPATGPPARTASPPPTTTAAATTTPAQAIAAACAKPQATASAASARPAPTTSATPPGPPSKRATEADANALHFQALNLHTASAA